MADIIFRVTFTIHDQPTMLLDHARMQELVTAAREGKGEFYAPNEVYDLR